MNRFLRKAADTAANVLFRSAQVIATHRHGDAFRTIRLGGEKLRGIEWIPGQKIQIQLSGLTMRTYTPMSWDADAGETDFLAYLHGDSPATNFLDTTTTGDRWQIFGPRSSVNLTKVERTPLLIGDESSFGLAAAWQHVIGRPYRSIFEVANVDASREALHAVGIAADQLVAAPNPGQHTALPELVADALGEHLDAHLVLTGRAQSIKHIRSHLKELQLRPPTTVKAYWDENRTGLD